PHPPSPHPPTSNRRSPLHRLLKGLPKVLLISLLMTALLMGVRYTGMLEAWELRTYDQLLRSRLSEPPDTRILIVTIDDQARQRYGAEKEGIGRISLSDRHLRQLLDTLIAQQPRVIGLDLYRDFPVDAEQAPLTTQLQQDERIIAVCKARYMGDDSIAPPPDVPARRVGFSDMLADADGVLRRHLLFMTAVYQDKEAPCTAPYALSVRVALQYLQAEGITPTFTSDHHLKLGEVEFGNLSEFSGGYHRMDAGGSQILLNYRVNPKAATQVPLSSILLGEVNPDVIRDRIILIGVTAESAPDKWITPLDRRMPGVIAQAHMTSEIISAVLDKRPLLWVWSFWGEVAWIGLWSIVGGILAWQFHPFARSRLDLVPLLASILLSATILLGLCFIIFLLYGGWIPLIPANLALLMTAIAVVLLGKRSGKVTKS
ncbi:MAG: CHASE2 domain-containing protein, partial [Cyanobacteria bacterium CRU_2_1]|nr:CHASE2 domain-containing protein [Cyanobacteria bacterium CRU_2_1]